MKAGKGTITRRTDAVLDGLQDEFASLYDRADFESKIEALKKAGTMSDRSSKLRPLFDMFDQCGIEYERGRDNDYYADLVKNADIPSFSEIENRMLSALFSEYKKYASPEEYMKRLVDRLSEKKDGWENDPLRLRILKQFIKYGDYLVDAGYSGRKVIRDYIKEKTGQKVTDETVLAELDDGVFLCLETATKEQKQPEGKYGLLQTADDLAAGRFRAGGSVRRGGATKKSLYLFAMVYGMTYYSGDENGATIIDPETDIETNLFRDYYANNLMRFISKTYGGSSREYETDPSGQGINYKNFAEMIYLYYISKDCGAQDKIRLSGEMIERVRTSRFKRGKFDTKASGGTAFYKNLFSEDILSMSESDFEAFICVNYDCDTYAGSYPGKSGMVDSSAGELQMETEQISAYEEYSGILKKLTDRGVALKDCGYGLWFTDVAAFTEEKYKSICGRRPEIDRERFGEFMELLSDVNEFMGTKMLSVTKPEAVTRTSIIVAYYYYYNALHENDTRDKCRNFKEVFKDFESGLDEILRAAYYQPITGKNIFDVLTAFSSYAYLNI